MAEELTDRQREILGYIRKYINENGYPPTVREIGGAFGIRSTNGVADHLKSLERKGYLTRGSLKSRALRPVHVEEPDPTFTDMPVYQQGMATTGALRAASITNLAEHRERVQRDIRQRELEPMNGDLVHVEIKGQVAAGAPILAQDDHDADTVQVDSFLLGGHRRVFALRVRGDSMIGDGIYNGDYIFVRKSAVATDGEIVVAMLGGPAGPEATVKRLKREPGRVLFIASNPKYAPIVVDESQFRETEILGVVIGVYRKMS